jgi:prophage endopeptidase
MKKWIVVLVALVVGVGILKAIEHQGYKRGVESERLAWSQRESLEVTRLNNAIVDAQSTARDAERKHAEDLAALSIKFQQEFTNVKRKNASDISAVRAGTLRLRDVSAGSAGQDSCRHSASETGAPAGGSPTAEGSYLSGAAAEFLLGLANEADEVVVQLTECQAILVRDRQ